MEKVEKISFSRWFWATTGGFLIGTFVILATLKYAELLHYRMFEYSTLVLSSFVAYMQYRALSEVHNCSKRWIWGGVLSFQIPFLIILSLEMFLNINPMYNDFLGALRVCAGSVIMGIYHSTILKKLNYTKVYLYPISYAIAFFSAFALIAGLGYINVIYTLSVVFFNVPSIIIIVCSYSLCTSVSFMYIQKQTFKDVVLPEDKWDTWRRELKEKEQNQ